MRNITRMFIRMNPEFRNAATDFFCYFPITCDKLTASDMDDIDHLWLGQPL